jgi:hypothetical protein
MWSLELQDHEGKPCALTSTEAIDSLSVPLVRKPCNYELLSNSMGRDLAACCHGFVDTFTENKMRELLVVIA